MKYKPLLMIMSFLGVLLMVVGFLLSTTTTTAQDEPNPLGEPGTFLMGYYNAWLRSSHANVESGSFNRWNNDGEIPVACASCHSTTGHLDFLGVLPDTEYGIVNNPAPIGEVVNCDACHNQVASNMTMVTFPSGMTITGIDTSSARCMDCHQGRSSGLTVANAIASAGAEEAPHAVNEDLAFVNIHFYAAASTLYGSEVQGGYQFDGKDYYPRYDHVEGFNTCDSCHSPHSLSLRITACATCHEGVENIEDVRAIRSVSSMVDYDGDGDVTTGIRVEIHTLQAMLYTAIQAYAAEVAGTPIVYGNSHPYFFIDTDGDGEASPEETVRANAYNQFTPVLLQAAYNYQVTTKDPGGYAHNPRYHIQLLYDSIEALNEGLAENAVDLSNASRDSFGHFEFTSLAFRYWDTSGEVPATCSKCHTATGLPFFLQHNVNIAMPSSNSLTCDTCHGEVASGDFSVFNIASVRFPSGDDVSFGENSASNICLECHQGRSSGVTIANAIARANVGDDDVSEALNFANPHYYATGASWFGSDANGAYQYEGKEYNGQFNHARRFNQCSDCHDSHSSAIRIDECTDCHLEVSSAADLPLIRADVEDKTPIDVNGNGDVTEGIAVEIESLTEALYVHIQAYARDVIGMPIAKGSNHPYYFNDLNDNGIVDSDEGQRANAYASWTPTLLRAVYNYQFVIYGAGGYAHNPDYILQVLYDSIEAIGGAEAVANYTRPPVRN